MMKTQNINTPITSQSARTHSAKQKMLFFLFLPMEKKKKKTNSLSLATITSITSSSQLPAQVFQFVSEVY